MRASAVIMVGLALLLTGCTTSDPVPEVEQSPAAVVPAVEGRTDFAVAEDGTQLAYRDWGGQGQAVVLLTDVGDTAAIYDWLGSQLAQQYRVVGITRRGFGESGAPADGYDIETRVSDNLRVLRRLDISSAIFIGHGISGDELVQLATRHRERTDAVVFLDAAAKERLASDPECVRQAQLWLPGWVVPDDDPVGSGVRQAEQVFGFPLPDSFASEVEASFDFGDDGVYTYTGSGGAFQSLRELSAANPQDYRLVTVPSLSIHAYSSTLETQFPWMLDERVPDEDEDAARECTAEGATAQLANYTVLQADNPDLDGQLWEQAHHYLYLQQPNRTWQAIELWLDQQGL